MSFFRRSNKESPPDDDSLPPPSDDESEGAPPSDSDDDLPPDDDESQAPAESLPPDSDEDDESDPDDETLPPNSDEDEDDATLPSDSDEDERVPEDAKRPSRRVSRHEKSESFDMTADDIGIDSPATKQTKAAPPPPTAPPPPPRMSERLSKSSKRQSDLIRDLGLPEPSPSFAADALQSQASEASNIEDDLASLSFGLQVKAPVKLDHSRNKSGARFSTTSQEPAPTRAASQSAHRASLLAAFNDVEATDPIPDVTVTATETKEPFKPAVVVKIEEEKKRNVAKKEITANEIAEFIMVNGCYEGDAYETLGVMVVDYGLQIYIKGADEIVEMSLQDIEVEGYQNDDLSFTLIQAENIKMFFRCFKKEERRTFFESLPEGLISFPSDADKQRRLYSVVSGKKLMANGRPSQIGFAPPPLSEHPDTTTGNLSVKELANLLNLDSELINAGSMVRRDDNTVQGHNRNELTETHIRRAHVCVRKAKQICKWLTSLHLQDDAITIQNYEKEFASGVYLAKLIRYLIPGSDFTSINERALSRGAAIKNIELSLQIIWRSKSVNSSRVASSAEIFEGNKLKIMIMLQEIFDVYVRKPLFGQAIKMLKWFNVILKQYNRRLPISVFTESDFSDVWKTFQSGTALFCLIYHLFGPTMIGEGHNVVRIDPMRVVNRPTNIIEYKSNVVYAFSLLKALNIEICWEPIDWITYPDVDFMMIQLQYIYDVIKNKHCVLPPAMGNVAGVASSVSGEPLVVGVIFSDTITVSIPTVTVGKPIGETKKRRAVGMVGSSEDNVTLLPIDSTGKTGRFAVSMCPFGLLSGNMRVVEAPITMKGARVMRKANWNSASENNPEQDRIKGSKHVMRLKAKNQVTTAKKDDKLLTAFSHHRVAGGVEEDLTMKRPTEVVIHEYTREGYKNNTMKLNPDGTVPVSSLPSISVEIVATAIEKLERDMAEAEAEIEISENDLSSQYLELEANAHKMGVRDYEKQISMLEKTRGSLEEERNNLHESFALRMESIKLQHAEAVARADAGEIKEAPVSPSKFAAGFKKKDAPLLAKVSSPTSSFKKTSQSSPSKSSTVRDSASSVGSSTKVVQREWISASHSNKSHNVLLKKKAELAERSISDQHMHPRAKARAADGGSDVGKDQPTKTKIDRKKLSELEVQNMSNDEAWNYFLDDLNARTEIHGTAAARIRKRPEVKSKQLGTDASVRSSQSSGVGGASNTSEVTGIGGTVTSVSKGNIVANTVRKEELAAMFAEDKRRQAWMKQQALNDVQSSVERRLSLSDLKSSLSNNQTSTPDLDKKMADMMKANENKLYNSKKETEHVTDNSAAGKDALTKNANAAVVAPRFDPSTFAPKDPESAFKWLSASRQFLLVDRISKTQYFFQLVKDGSGGKNNPNYIFTWKNLIHSQTFEGAISLNLCKSIVLSPADPTILVITIEKSPTALKQSGGRTSISIKCTSEIECGKYFASMNLLVKSENSNENANQNNTNKPAVISSKSSELDKSITSN